MNPGAGDKIGSDKSAHVYTVIVRGEATGFTQRISAGTHELTADEPAANGGTDKGPTPYDLLLAALGS